MLFEISLIPTTETAAKILATPLFIKKSVSDLFPNGKQVVVFTKQQQMFAYNTGSQVRISMNANE